MLRFVVYFCLLAGMGLLFVSVLLGVDFGWCVLSFYYLFWNVLGVGQTIRSRQLEKA